MGRWIAIDFGARRCGIAVTDPLRIIASGLTTVPTPELLAFLDRYLAEESVDRIVLGEPFHLDGTPTDLQPRIRELGVHLGRKFPDIEIMFWDERFTSKLAQEVILGSGAGKKARRDKGLVDRVAAGLILQEVLDAEDKKKPE